MYRSTPCLNRKLHRWRRTIWWGQVNNLKRALIRLCLWVLLSQPPPPLPRRLPGVTEAEMIWEWDREGEFCLFIWSLLLSIDNWQPAVCWVVKKLIVFCFSGSAPCYGCPFPVYALYYPAQPIFDTGFYATPPPLAPITPPKVRPKHFVIFSV